MAGKKKTGISQKSAIFCALREKVLTKVKLPSEAKQSYAYEVFRGNIEKALTKCIKKNKHIKNLYHFTNPHMIEFIMGTTVYRHCFSIELLNSLCLIAEGCDYNTYFQKFCNQTNIVKNNLSHLENSSLLYNDSTFSDADDLDIGDDITIGWGNVRYMKLRLIGDCEFEVIECEPKNYVTGERIFARWFVTVLDQHDNGCSMYARIAAVYCKKINTLNI